ncbi:hypothetical protein BGZ47_004505 [Haplosporangium gracile]|nr:hypothetical protein BGZ47_004505 [Haplosporangium gracile]
MSLPSPTFVTLEGLIIADHALLFLIFVYAAVPRFPAKVPRYARAFMLFVMAAYTLYFHLNTLSNDFLIKNFLCGRVVDKNACGVSSATTIFSTIAGFLIMYENALTLKETDPNPSIGAAVAEGAGGAGGAGGRQPDPNVVPYPLAMQTPPSMQQTYPQQQQFQQQGIYYPQQQQLYVLAQQQLLQDATHKLAALGQAQQQQQFQPQPLYQLTPQQQQQQQFYQPLHPSQQPLQQQQQNPYPQQQQQQQTVAVQPMVPGSLVTTTPQPGGQAIAPYTSSGGASIAVSPVLPVGGYSTPSPSVGHQSPVHPSPVAFCN